MTLRFFAIVSALVPALGGATPLAHPAAHAFAQSDQAGVIYHSTLYWPYVKTSALTANAAYVGDGSDPSYVRDQPNVFHEPVYDFSGG
jgi:hypothetical protein